jgi:hypothetical protein
VDGVGERGGWSFGVVEGYDEDVLGVGEGAIPFVVVADVADAEAAAMDGEEGWERGGGGLVVGLGEEYPVRYAISPRVSKGETGETHRTGRCGLHSYVLMMFGAPSGGEKYSLHSRSQCNGRSIPWSA